MPEPAKGRDVMVGSLSEARINVKITTNQRLWGGRGIPRPAQSRWVTREQIRAACMIALAPLLEKRGLAFRDRGAGNVEVLEYKGLLIKASYWRWPDHDLAGNSGKSTMSIRTATPAAKNIALQYSMQLQMSIV